MNAQALLTGALQRIAANENDSNALIDAGTAAIVLEDARAAYGFFNRALSLSSNNGRAKAGLGSALVRLENPDQALQMFQQATALGVSERMFLVDRGMAYDLVGDNARAQQDYQSALRYQPSDRAQRYYALSLGILGHTDQAIQGLATLLQKKDRAAWRDRAFILAMNGRTKEAMELVKTTMPANVAAGLTPYLTKMNRLSNRQMALAVHYGQFPTSDTQLAAVGRGAQSAPATRPSAASAKAVPRTTIAARTPARRTQARADDPLAGKRFIDEKGRPLDLTRSEKLEIVREEEEKRRAATALAERKERERVSAAARQQQAARQAIPPRRPPVPEPIRTPAVSAPPPTFTPQPVYTPANAVTTQTPVETVTREIQGPTDSPSRIVSIPLPPSTPAEPTVFPSSVPSSEPPVVKAFSLADLVQAIEPPGQGPVRSEAPVDQATLDKLRAESEAQRRAEAAKVKAEAERKRIADAQAQQKRDADAKVKREADAAAKVEADKKKAQPARSWVQIGTGNLAAMPGDYRRVSAGQNAVLFKGKSAHSAAFGKSHRLVVGPFATGAEANAWLAKFRKNGGSGFVWTSSAGDEVDQIGGK